MIVKYLSTENDGIDLIVSILIINKEYKYVTSEYIERMYRKRRKYSELKALNYLKKNSKQLNGEKNEK